MYFFRTIIAAAGLSGAPLATGCIADISDPVSDTQTTSGGSSSSDGSSGGSSSSDESSGDGSSGGDSSTGHAMPTTSSSTSSSTTDGGTTADGSSSTGDVPYGGCGWSEKIAEYSCSGGLWEAEPGVADPSGVHPLDCPEALPEHGDPCDDTSPVTSAGCCLPTGWVYQCVLGQIDVGKCDVG